jgi:hypothetical protein
MPCSPDLSSPEDAQQQDCSKHSPYAKLLSRIMHYQFRRIVPVTIFEIGSFQPGENPLLSDSRKIIGKVVLSP